LAYVVDLPVFQGPLDLLLHLVRRHEMDIYDIPIAALADQYMITLAEMERLDLDFAGEFLVMAATLLEIKSRMLLPAPLPDPEDGEAEDPRAELTRRLVEYQLFKEAAEQMREMEALSLRWFGRGGVEVAGDYPFDGPPYRNGTMDGLVRALQRMLVEAASDLSLPGELPRDRWTIPLKMREIAVLLHHHPEGVHFHETMEPGADRIEIIVTFLAVLEMLKRGRVQLVQDGPWGSIRLVPVLHSEVRETAESTEGKE
jgi:segregation and condensation protein A